MSDASVKLSPEPKTSFNVARLELDNVERYGAYVRLHYEDRSYTNFEELQYAGRIARVLMDRGVKPGDRVMAVMPNIPELTATIQAVWTIGAVLTPVTPQWTAAEIGYALRNSGAVAVVTCAPLAARVREAANGVSTLKHLLVFGATDVPGMVNIAPEVADAPCRNTPVDRSPSDMAMLLYTSGTTAKPKGVVLTHANIPAAMQAVERVNPDLPRRPMLHVLPLTHIFGSLMLQLSNRWGFQSVLVRHFDPVGIFEAVQRHQIGYVLMVPTMLVYLLHHPARPQYDFTSLYRIITGGASLPEQLRLGFQQAFRCRVDQGYGMSETGFASCYGDHESYRNGSVGWPCPGFEIRIVDEQNRPLPPRSVGEICMTGASITPGYWQDPVATRESFHGSWFRTGDIGYVDEDGYLYITDRKKDLIIKGGENISPREIEEVIYLHPAVAETAVVGIPNALFGEDICAVIQLRPGAEATEDEIREHVARFLTKFKVPSRVVFQAALPKNSTGKINKMAIREQLAMPEAA
ncbi:MAG TPA: AMP-binding protein [Terriglobales bacterium]|nr:AMP-binding protein [Terriglobales bacterium]